MNIINYNSSNIIYNKKYTYTKKDIIIVYINILIIYQNKINDANLNCFFNGVSIITTVFKIMLLYTKNIDVTKYNTINSITYFCEFIKLIHIDNINISYNDIKSFIYDKTILLIDKDLAYTNTFNKCNIPSDIYTFIINVLFKSIKKQNNNILQLMIDNNNILDIIINNHNNINIDKFIDEILYNK